MDQTPFLGAGWNCPTPARRRPHLDARYVTLVARMERVDYHDFSEEIASLRRGRKPSSSARCLAAVVVARTIFGKYDWRGFWGRSVRIEQNAENADVADDRGYNLVKPDTDHATVP